MKQNTLPTTTVPTVKFMKHTGRPTPKQGLPCLFYVNMYMIGLMQCPNGWRNGCYFLRPFTLKSLDGSSFCFVRDHSLVFDFPYVLVEWYFLQISPKTV